MAQRKGALLAGGSGAHDSLPDVSQFIAAIERRQGLKIACPEEIAFHMGYIDAAQMEKLARPLIKSDYGKYLMAVLNERRG